MKNLINYYYNLAVTNFKKSDGKFLFNIGKDNYEFVPFTGNEKMFYEIYLVLLNNSRYCDEIVYNKSNSILTLYDGKQYILLKKTSTIDRYVDSNEILSYDLAITGNYKLNWKNLWKDKIDYYEYQMSQVSFKYPILKSSFNYYVGLTENAIALLNYINESEIKYYISHKRIEYKEKVNNFFNPLNVTIDTKVRDIAEYIKVNYIYGGMPIYEITDLIDYCKFNYTETILLLARLMYPSYYFDIYDQIIAEKVEEEKLNYLIKKNTEYEVFLKNIYMHVRNKYPIIEIEWLKF